MQISHVIKKYGYTIDEVGERMGLGDGVLRSYVGRESVLTLPFMRKLAGIIGCSVGEFFDDERVEDTAFHGVQPRIDIRSVMHRKGVSNKELATRMNTTEQNICGLIKKDSLTTKKLSEIASALDVPVTDLFSYDAAAYRKILAIEIAGS